MLDREITLVEIRKNKTGVSDGIVEELLTYGWSGMIGLLQQLFAVNWREEFVPPQWKEGFVVNTLQEGRAGFRVKRGCVDNIYMLNELVQGRLREGLFILSSCSESL